jgi:hypothetical protein
MVAFFNFIFFLCVQTTEPIRGSHARNSYVKILSPFCRELHMELKHDLLVKIFPSFHSTWRFIPVFTTISYSTLPSASWNRNSVSITPKRSILFKVLRRKLWMHCPSIICMLIICYSNHYKMVLNVLFMLICLYLQHAIIFTMCLNLLGQSIVIIFRILRKFAG